jgi:HD-GYP domain-containing protein (c-di-GMP phosphodiesterase class II)
VAPGVSNLPLRARLFWTLNVTAGLAILAASLWSVVREPIDWLPAALLLVAGLATQAFVFPYSFRRTANTQVGSLSSAFNVASFLLLEPGQAVIVTSLSFGLGGLIRRSPWFKLVFNISQYALVICLAGWMWNSFGSGSGALSAAQHLVVLLLVLGVYFVLNTGAVSLMIALVDTLPLRYVWLRNHRHILPAYFGMLFSGVLLANLWSNDPWSVLLALIPLIAIYYAFAHSIELEQQTLTGLFHLADILDQRDYYTHKHSTRVGEEAEKLALRLGAPVEEAYLIYLCGRLHDIGKCAVNNEVLLKPGPLDQRERKHMWRHPEVGGQMLTTFSLFRVGAKYVRGHHEWFDGSGYPDGLNGANIPFGARVIAVADAWDAMTSDRPYRMALPYTEAAHRLRAGRGRQWDPAIVDAYLELVAERLGQAPEGQVPEGHVPSPPPSTAIGATARS